MTEHNALSSFLRQLYEIEPLSIEEEVILAERIQNGDELARNKLVEHNLRFIPYVLKKMPQWQYSNIAFEDFIACGYEALLLAAKKWKPQEGIKFVGFAKPFIERSVVRYTENHGNIIRLPSNVIEEIRRIKYAETQLIKQLNCEPTIDQVSNATNLSQKRIRQLLSFIQLQPSSLEALNTDHLDTIEDGE